MLCQLSGIAARAKTWQVPRGTLRQPGEEMDKIVYFVRHGQSLGNAAAIFQPPESPLSETGRRQAACIAARIAKLARAGAPIEPLPAREGNRRRPSRKRRA